MQRTYIRGLFDYRKTAMTADELRVLYRWLSIPRYATILVSAMAIASFWLLHELKYDPRPILLGLVPCFVLVSMVTEVLVRRNMHPLLALNLQLLTDLVGVSIGVWMTGGVESPFTLLYVLVIISASLISVRTLLTFGVAIALIYQGAAFAQRSGLSPGFEGSASQDPLTFVVFVLIIGLIAFQSSYYVSRIREKDEEVIRLKDEFLYRTIHDLRSPSTAIRFTIEKYKSDAAFLSRPDVQGDFAMVEAALDRMSLLIEDLLKIAAGDNPVSELKRDAVDLRPLIRDAAGELSPQMAKKGVVFEYVPAADVPPVFGESEKIREAVVNFLDNAIKYNRDGGRITVTHRVENDQLLTDIADTGTGIAEKHLSRLFTPFYRADVGTDIVGTGLGLYMTRKLLRKMRGDVVVTSTVGVGTTFTVSLPTSAGK